MHKSKIEGLFEKQQNCRGFDFYYQIGDNLDEDEWDYLRLEIDSYDKITLINIDCTLKLSRDTNINKIKEFVNLMFLK